MMSCMIINSLVYYTDIIWLNPISTSDSKMRTLSNSEDPDEMLHSAAFHQGLHCLLRLKRTSEQGIQFYLEIITCDPSNHTTDHSKVIVLNQREESIMT